MGRSSFDRQKQPKYCGPSCNRPIKNDDGFAVMEP